MTMAVWTYLKLQAPCGNHQIDGIASKYAFEVWIVSALARTRRGTATGYPQCQRNLCRFRPAGAQEWRQQVISRSRLGGRGRGAFAVVGIVPAAVVKLVPGAV